jgi:2-polyprenyl-6-methoxyphenol hydroxylase-like FAD-dependent oxidoreductase
MNESRDHAVVIGGSLAGLLAARVLSDHFRRVTIVERDTFPSTPEFRPGIPQSRHLHVLWTRGLEIMDGLFPGLADELRDAGVPELAIPADVAWLTSAGWRSRFDLTTMLTFSRPLLDWTIRNRLSLVRMVSGHEVTGLVADGRDVAGVEIRSRGSAVTESLETDFVVDASGRGSRAPEWLVALGYPAPPETRIDPLLGYASRYYAIPEGFDPGWKALYLQANPPGDRRTGGLFPQEGGRWICSLSGAGGDYGPTGEDEFLDFAKGLRSPLLYEAIRHAEPLTPITGFRRTSNHRRHYERLREWPGGFVVLGDAACAFNPIYGQGMSVAALSALALDRSLRTDLRRFQRRAARTAAGAWLIATGEDLRYPETVAPPIRLRTRFINRYVDRVVATANTNPAVCARLLDVLALKSTPPTLFRPSVLARVARRPPTPDRSELPAQPATV